MQLKVVGSSSRGNGYIFETVDSALIIECGIRFSEVKKAIDFKTYKISGALISHSHKDHCGFVSEFLKAGIKVYASTETVRETGIDSHNWNEINGDFKIAEFQIKPFELVHGVKCLGFLIKHPESGIFCFITDTHYCPVKFKGLNNIIIECNYGEDILEDNITNGKLQPVVRNQVLVSHLSFETCKDFLKANDISEVNNIVLIHLSGGNSDAAGFKAGIKTLTGKNVVIAEKGLSMNFDKSPF